MEYIPKSIRLYGPNGFNAYNEEHQRIYREEQYKNKLRDEDVDKNNRLKKAKKSQEDASDVISLLKDMIWEQERYLNKLKDELSCCEDIKKSLALEEDKFYEDKKKALSKLSFQERKLLGL